MRMIGWIVVWRKNHKLVSERIYTTNRRAKAAALILCGRSTKTFHNVVVIPAYLDEEDKEIEDDL